jgi:hypothetical protein
LIHVNELTQPQGHSSSGSHERYKDANRLAGKEISIVFTNETMDDRHQHCLPRKLMLLMLMQKEVLEAKKAAWNAFIEPIVEEQKQLVGLLES